MAYLYEDKELVFKDQMKSLKNRVVAVNSIIFIANVFATIILYLSDTTLVTIAAVVVPTYILNLLILYAYSIDSDSMQQLYLSMYISIIGTIAVVNHIFLIEKTPNTYILIYFAIAVISIYREKKAVILGYLITLGFASIIHFKYTDNLVNDYNDFLPIAPYVYQFVLLLIIFIQSMRTIFNERELNKLYGNLNQIKELELKYHSAIIRLLGNNKEINTYNEFYNNDETKKRLSNYVDLFQTNFNTNEDLKTKLDTYLELQETRNPNKVISKRLGGYRIKKEIQALDEFSIYKLSKMISLILNISFTDYQSRNLNQIKNFDQVFEDPEMSFENKVIGFIILYEQLRNQKPYVGSLDHERVLQVLKNDVIYEKIDKEIIDFFYEHEQVFKDIFDNKEIDLIDESE